MRIPRIDADGNPLPCTIEGCAGKRAVSGLCVKHSKRKDSGRSMTEKSKYEKTSLERFLEKVNKSGGMPAGPHPLFGGGECWIWLGARRGSDMKDPYGAFRDAGKQNTAHRWSYEHFVEKIGDESATLDHLCRNRLCVNYSHLEVVSTQENTKRREDMRTHCKHGHLYDDINTYHAPNGSRGCKTCRANASTRQRIKNRRAV